MSTTFFEFLYLSDICPSGNYLLLRLNAERSKLKAENTKLKVEHKIDI